MIYLLRISNRVKGGAWCASFKYYLDAAKLANLIKDDEWSARLIKASGDSYLFGSLSDFLLSVEGSFFLPKVLPLLSRYEVSNLHLSSKIKKADEAFSSI